jgi:periplasmic protein TonB
MKEKAVYSLAGAGRPTRRNGSDRFSFAAACGVTAAIFCGLPYVERLSPAPMASLESRAVDTLTLAPPPPPPPKLPEPREETPPPSRPELSQPRQPLPINVALDLNWARNEWGPGDFTPDFTFSFGAPVEPRGVFDMSDLDAAPRPVAQMRPLYPSRARSRRVEGVVNLVFVVDAEGRVRDIEVEAARPSGYFEEAARRAAARWRFTPGMRNGVPVAVRVRQAIRFQLEDF